MTSSSTYLLTILKWCESPLDISILICTNGYASMIYSVWCNYSLASMNISVSVSVVVSVVSIISIMVMWVVVSIISIMVMWVVVSIISIMVMWEVAPVMSVYDYYC
jgi:hypothetical protein